MTLFYVWQHEYGRKRIARGPCEGLLEWPKHQWGWTAKYRSLAKAIDDAKAHPFHAVVTRDDSGMDKDRMFDNGKAPGIPEGWYAPEAQIA